MSQFTHTQKAAALIILDEAVTAKEFTTKFNTNFDTKHDEMDIAILLREFEVSGIIQRCGVRWDGQVIFLPLISKFYAYQIVLMRKAIEVEQLHIKAYWANH